MSQIRFYADEDAAEHAVMEGLRQRAVDVLTVLEAGRGEETDDEQLEFAATVRPCPVLAQRRALLSIAQRVPLSRSTPCRHRRYSSPSLFYR